MNEVKEQKVENLSVNIYQSVSELGVASAKFVAEKLNSAILKKGEANLILATGASQFSFIQCLKNEIIDWSKITVFHLDEYEGISDNHPASFRKYLKERILEQVQPKQVHYLHGDAPDVEAEILKYENLLKDTVIDVACIGIGENGHIAFNDPPVADFNDPYLVKVVELDEACRRQQLGEGWFSTFEEVPTHALSLTIPAIMRCDTISCAVPDARKAQAVYDTLNAEVSTAYPSTILRKHNDCVLFLDSFSASLLK
ncbi:glucosamine-6-phosphate deaminase [Mangrovibacterium diazotrophicum]|uniref:Glucosamine-6-phosphate deaminase n=1 Tax=Mangrovibacterium diazotrophicum TaxID=1261403 RepID=A0A419VW86_9BACT|nr:glucosamine-6-phosphate deaminase [Mangrovibacterium diazotrophicum]RKD86378.1 glucosamine-6-phosphate deaminase [Mangrovibacterium diazotrophicum]